MLVRKFMATMGVAMGFTLLGGGAAFAAGSPGDSDDTPGTHNAFFQCQSAVVNQTDMGVVSGGGPKEGIDAPTNCDQYYLDKGLIGPDGG